MGKVAVRTFTMKAFAPGSQANSDYKVEKQSRRHPHTAPVSPVCQDPAVVTNSATLSARASQKSEGTKQQGYGSQGLRRKLPHLSLDILHAKMVHEHQHPIVQRGQHLGRLALLHLTGIFP